MADISDEEVQDLLDDFMDREMEANHEVYEALSNTRRSDREPLALFLDIDGPLVPIRPEGPEEKQHLYHCSEVIRQQYSNTGSHSLHPVPFEPVALDSFLTLFWALWEAYDVYVVISSTWRLTEEKRAEVWDRLLTGQISTNQAWRQHFPDTFEANRPPIPKSAIGGHTPSLNGAIGSSGYTRGQEISCWLGGERWLDENLSGKRREELRGIPGDRFGTEAISDRWPKDRRNSVRGDIKRLAIDDDSDVAPHPHLMTKGLEPKDVAEALRMLWPSRQSS